MSSSFGCILHVWISLQLILSSLYIDYTLSIVHYSFGNCSFEFKKKCDAPKSSLNEIANITWNVDQRRTKKEEQPSARNFLMVESQDTIHYTTSHKETLRKLNDTLWNSWCRSIILGTDECSSIYVHEIDVKIMHCVIKGLNFCLVAIYHKLDIAQINAKIIFRNKLNDFIRGIVMMCNYINCNYRQQCTIFSNMVLPNRKNKMQDQYFNCNAFKSQKLQLKNLKIILKFLLSQVNQNFKKINRKSTIVHILSNVNFFIGSSFRRGSSNSLFKRSVTCCQSEFKSLKNLKNLSATYQYDKRMANSNKSVNNVKLNRQSTIETNNNKRNQLIERRHFTATKLEKADKKNNLVKKLLITNKNARFTTSRKIPAIDVQSKNTKYNEPFQKRRLLSVKNNKKLNSKNRKKTRKKLPFKSKARKSKRHVRSSHDRLFNGNKKVRNKKSNPMHSSPPITLHKNKIILETKGALGSSRDATSDALFDDLHRTPSKVSKNDRRSASRLRSPLSKKASVGKIDDKRAKLKATCRNCEDRLRRQQTIRNAPLGKSADTDEVIDNSQGKSAMQSDITVDKRNYISEIQNSPEKLIWTLSITGLKENLENDSVPLGLFIKDSKLRKLPKTVKIEIVGPTKRKGVHEKREILASNNYPQVSVASDKSVFNEGMKLEQELKELPKLQLKPRLNKLRNLRNFGKLRSNSRGEESNAGADVVDSKVVDPVQPIRSYPSAFADHQHTALDSVRIDRIEAQSKSENLQDFSKNLEKEKALYNHERREIEKGPDKESSVYYYDYYDYENSGSNVNPHKSNDLKARQVGRKLLSLGSADLDEDVFTRSKKLNSHSDEKLYGNQRSEKVESRPHYSLSESSSLLFLESGEIIEGSSASKSSQCTFNKSIAQFRSDRNDRAKDANRKSPANIGFLKRNLKSVQPAPKSSLPEDDPLRRLFESSNSEESKGEIAKQTKARYKRRSSDKEDRSINDLFKLFGRDSDLSVKTNINLHLAKSPKKNANNSPRRKRCSGRKRPKGRRRRRCRKRKFTGKHQRAPHPNDINNDSLDDLNDEGKVQQPLAGDPKSPLEKIKNFLKTTFGEDGRKKIKAKIIKVIPGNLGELAVEDSDSGELKSWQGNRRSSCKCKDARTTTPGVPEVIYTSVAVDTINPGGDDAPTTLGDLTRPPPRNYDDDSGDNYKPSDKTPGVTRGYNCHCHMITNEDGSSSPDEQPYQTTIGMNDYSPESSSANNDLNAHTRPVAEMETSQLPDLLTQTSPVYTSPVINTENPISSDNALTTIDSNTNLGNDVKVNGGDERMKDVLDILNFVQKVEKLMVNHNMPLRIGDKKGGIEIKLQKIYTPGKKQTIQDPKDVTAVRTPNGLLTKPMNPPRIHETVKTRPDSFPSEMKENRVADAGYPQKQVEVTFDQLKKQKEDEHVDEFETYIEGRPVDLLSNKKPEKNEKPSAEKQKIVQRDQPSAMDSHARRRRKRRRRPKGRRDRMAPGRRRLFSVQQSERRSDFALASVDRDAEEQQDCRGHKSPAYWHYTRCSNKKRKKPAGSATRRGKSVLR